MTASQIYRCTRKKYFGKSNGFSMYLEHQVGYEMTRTLVVYCDHFAIRGGSVYNAFRSDARRHRG
jgi:hypothetical protein